MVLFLCQLGGTSGALVVQLDGLLNADIAEQMSTLGCYQGASQLGKLPCGVHANRAAYGIGGGI